MIPPHLELGERGEFALRWLAEEAPAPIDALDHNPHSAGGYAHGLAAAMRSEGLLGERYNWRGDTQGAANTLVALKRRGLARNSTPGGEAFQSVRWGITEEGVEHLNALDDWRDAHEVAEKIIANREET